MMSPKELGHDIVILIVCGLVIGIVAMITSGCGGPPALAYTVTTAAGEAIVAGDEVLGEQAETITDAAAADARAAHPDDVAARVAAYEVAVAALNDAVEALDVARHSWLTLAHALEAWDAGADGADLSWQRVAACTAASLTRLTRALVGVGIDVPDLIEQTAHDIGDMAGNLCVAGMDGARSAEGHTP